MKAKTTLSLTILGLVALTVTLGAGNFFSAATQAQDADAVDTDAGDEDAEAKGPKGLDPDRALPGQIPTWWIKADKPSLDVQEHKLKNGMRVLLLKHGTLPVCATYMWYKVGAKDEVPGLTGMAHFLEHMMFKGSEHYRKGEVDEATVKHGGSNNAFTSSEYTAYHFTFPVSSLDVALDIERDRMTTLTLDPKEFAAEKQVVLSEVKIDDDTPSDRLWRDIMRAIYGPGHPYSWRVLGKTRDVESCTDDDMRRFWEMYYTPDNATLVVVGGIDPEATLEKVKAKFADIPRSTHKRIRPNAKWREPRERKAHARITRLAEVKTPRGQIVLPGDSMMSIRNPVRDVLASILADGETSRLYKRLVVEEELCDSVYAFNWERDLGGTFHFGFSMKENADEATRQKVESIIEEELQKIAKEGVTDEEVKRAVLAREVSEVFGRENADSIAEDLGRTQISYGDWKYTDHWLETIKQVDASDVQQVADDWKFSRDAVYAWLLPKDRPTGDTREVTAPELPVLDVKEVTLENGLRLLMLPQNEGADVFTLQIGYQAGTRTEPLGKRGLANLFSATVGAGTESRTRLQIQEEIENLGGSIGASSGGVSGRVLARDAGALLDVAADILRHANFPEAEIERERSILLAALERLPEDHSNLARRAFFRSVYGAEHPFGTYEAWQADVVKGITRADLVSHYEHYVAPNNTRIVCVGKFDPAVIEKQVRELLGDWKKVDAASDRRSAELKSAAREGIQSFEANTFADDAVNASGRTILVNRPDKEQCAVIVGGLGFKRDHPDYYAAKLLETILGYSPAFSDRFTRILRDEMGLAYSTYAYLTLRNSEEPGVFWGYIGTSPEKVSTALKGMRTILQDTITNEVSDQELTVARNYLLSSVVFDLEGSGALAGLIYDIDRYGLGWDYLQKYRTQIAAVTKADILRVAKAYIQPDKLVTVVAGELERIPNGREFFEEWNLAGTE